MTKPDSQSLSDRQTPVEHDFDPSKATPPAHAWQESTDSLSDRKTTGGIVGDSTSSADLKAAADHLDDVEFEFVDLSRLYDIFEPLGEGGMGTVYRAIEKQSRHPLAIKRLKSDLVGNRRARARFQSEGNAMLKLTHENIVRFFRMGCDAESPFYVMELVAGGSLKDRLEQGKLELDEAVRMFVALAGGLSLSHRSGIIHRDIKPGNILLTLDGVPKLSDFGIARQVEGSGLTSTGAAMGTPFYMAPEQERDGKAATELSDLFSLAATLYHAVTGELPISVRESRIPEPIRETTLKALEEDPAQRHPSVAEFGAELRSVQMQLSGPASVAHDSVDLKDGECAHCHTINPLTRKFCKAKGCGKPLVEPCPNCETPSPVWEAICAECGTDISANWEAAEQDLQNQAREIETLAAEQDFEAALKALEPFRTLTQTRWQKWKNWANENAAQYQFHLSELQTHRDDLLRKAQDEFKAARYSSVISLLGQIHPVQVTEEVRSLRSLSTACLDELDQLIQTIKQQVSSKDFEGLRRNVDRVLTISPGDQRVTKLDQGLRAREESILAKRLKAREQRLAEQQEQETLKKQQAEEAARLKKERIEARLQKQLEEAVSSDPFSGAASASPHSVDSPNRTKDLGVINRLLSTSPGPSRKPTWKHFLLLGGVFFVLLFVCSGLLPRLFSRRDQNQSPRTSGDAVLPVVQPATLRTAATRAGEVQEITLPGGVKLKMIWCPPGSFTMGSPANEKDRDDDENQVEVTLMKGFWLGQTEVTQEQWTAVMGSTSTPWSSLQYVKEGSNFPASYISHGLNADWTIEADSATAFCRKLTELERKAGRLVYGLEYELPTEAQWEYACRAGTKTAYSFGDDISQLSDYAWWGGFSGGGNAMTELYSHPVGTRKPNPWGIFDMHGNVIEWCQEESEVKYLGDVPQNLDAVPSRVLRGGSWANDAGYSRSAYRDVAPPVGRSNVTGFRISMTQ